MFIVHSFRFIFPLQFISFIIFSLLLKCIIKQVINAIVHYLLNLFCEREKAFNINLNNFPYIRHKVLLYYYYYCLFFFMEERANEHMYREMQQQRRHKWGQGWGGVVGGVGR